ncbi:MAG: hypothetical protein JXR56_07720 [Candidatus Cloacimonetes bacterium]|nr:hypothetical protein [Candidatus Cloacimonadota bacterium]
MKQYNRVIQVMKENGGYATLGFLNQHVDVAEWITKTPYASIRRIVQDDRFFFKIRPGLWALNEYKKDILDRFEISDNTKSIENEKFSHTYFQGLIVEIGKLKGFETYIPTQDRNKLFLTKTLSEIADSTVIYDFTYPEIVSRAKTIDVIWFHENRLPHTFIEVEHTTDFQNSLLKFVDLQYFYSDFIIAGSNDRKREFESKININVFRAIRSRVKFIDYDNIARTHANLMEKQSLMSIW